MTTSKPPFTSKSPASSVPLSSSAQSEQPQYLPSLQPIPFRTAYGPTNRVQLVKKERSGKTKQSFKDESDINFILARFKRTRVIDWVDKYPARYGDATGYDFQDALNIVVKGREAFAALPASIRSRFANDPAQFLDFVHDKANEEEMRKMGLLNPVARPADDLATRVAPPPH